MNSRRPPLLRRWWPLIALIAVGLVLVAGKLSLRSAATGEPLIPGVAGAPVLGPQPTPTWTPGPGRVGLRVRVIDTRGEPVPQAIVEVRDGFNRAVGTQETGISGEALLLVPPDRSYVVTARKPGFQQGRIEEVQAPPAPAGNQSAPSGRSPGGDGGARVNIAVTRQQAPLVEIRLAAAESAVLGSAPRLLIGHNTLRISLIDAASNLLLKHSEPLGQGRVTLIAPAKDRGRLFASWLGSTEFLVLRTADLAVERKVALEAGGVTSLAVHPKTGRVWVATAAADTSDSGVLHELDPEAEQVLRRVPVGQTVTGMRFQPDGSALYLPQRNSNVITIFDPAGASALGRLVLPQWASDYAFSPDGQSLYVVNLASQRLVEIDTKTGTLKRSIEVGTGANSVLAHPDGKRLFVGNQLLGYVQAIDVPSGQIADLIPVGRAPQALALAPGDDTLYVANSGSGSVSVVDLGKRAVKETINTGGAPATLLVIADV